MQIIDEIYSLIKNNNDISIFINNIDLFKELNEKENLNFRKYGSKLIEIYKYIFLNFSKLYEVLLDSNKNFILELKDNMEDDICNFLDEVENQINFNEYDKKNMNKENIYSLMNIIETINTLRKEEDKQSYKNLTLDTHITCISTLINFLKRELMTLDKDYIEKINDTIFLLTNYIVTNNNESNISYILDDSYIEKYIKEYLKLYKFMGRNIENDPLVNALKQGIIKDKHIAFKAAINLLFAFENASSFVDIIEKNFDETDIKRILFVKYIDYCLNINESLESSIIKFFVHNEKGNYYLSLIPYKEEALTRIISNRIEYLTMKEYTFIYKLLKDYEPAKYALFLLRENMLEENKANNNIENNNDDKQITFEEAINILRDDLVYHKGNIDIETFTKIIKVIAKKYVLDDANIYISYTKLGYGGCVDDLNYNSITFNMYAFKQCYNIDGDFVKFYFLHVMFHEIRHYHQFKNLKSEENRNYLMENLLYLFYDEYYIKNYNNISYEHDANLSGAKETVKFLKEYFPELTNSINEYIEYFNDLSKKDKKELFQSEKDFNGYIKSTTEELFKKLIELNPGLLNVINNNQIDEEKQIKI